MRAKIKFPNLSWQDEYRLIHESGFSVHSRKTGEWIIFTKEVKKPVLQAFDVLVNGELTPDIQMQLRRRCNAVYSFYEDPKSNISKTAIRARLNNIAATLPKYQAKFIRDWIVDNIDSDDDKVVVVKRNEG